MSDDLTLSVGFGLNWAGKSDAWKLAYDPVGEICFWDGNSPAGALDVSQNLIVEADNLIALKLLLPVYSGKVSVIYIDPPYNTGNDFGYCDNYRSSVRSSASINSTSTKPSNALGNRLHSRWLSMILPRLVMAREMLCDDGLIFISIDDNEIDKLRLLMAEIFGERNFIGQVTVLSNPRGRQAERHFAAVHEYLLVFAKNADKVVMAGVQLTDEQAHEFRLVDEQGRRYRLLGLRQRGSASRQQDRPALHYPIYIDPLTKKVSTRSSLRYSEVALPKKSNGQAGRWMWSQERLSAKLDVVEGRLISRRNEWDVFVRDFLCDNAGQLRKRKVSTLWTDATLNYQNGKRQLKELVGEAPVDYPKPVALIKKAIALIGKSDAIVLDFFAGTGTTGQAVMELNIADSGSRKFILVQQPEPLKGGSRFATISELCIARVIESAKACGIKADIRCLRVGHLD